MDPNLIDLYRELGFADPLPSIATSLALGVAPTAKAVAPPAALPPADLATIEQLKRYLDDEADAAELMAVVGRTIKAPLSEEGLRAALQQTETALREPKEAVQRIRAMRSVAMSSTPPLDDVPPIPGIDVQPNRHDFETFGDLDGWIVNCGPYWIKQKLGTLDRPAWRSHAGKPSGFVYSLKAPSGATLTADDRITIALFSDFGTRTYNARYIAHHLEQRRPDYAIHLGDVYYSGRPKEVERHLIEPLAGLTKKSRVFSLNANHEMLSGGFAYFDYLDSKRSTLPGEVEQEQEGSYFCLWSDRYQLIALDTSYDYRNDGSIHSEAQRTWLRQQLTAGRDKGRINILLTQHEPFGLGESKASRLLADVESCGGKALLDFWFWGDEHYCALFQRNAQVPFVGSCIGHAGYPVEYLLLNPKKKRNDAGEGFAFAEFVDVSPRFKNQRPDLANSGYCVLELTRNRLTISYKDWLDRDVTMPKIFSHG